LHLTIVGGGTGTDPQGEFHVIEQRHSSSPLLSAALLCGSIGPGGFLRRRGLTHPLDEPVAFQVFGVERIHNRILLPAKVRAPCHRVHERPRRPVHHRASPYSPAPAFLTRTKPFHLMTLPPTYTLPRCATGPDRNL